MGGANATTGITEWLLNLFPYVNLFIQSNFTTSLLGAGAGAWAGAWAAQHIAERSKKREELVREIRNVNAALAVCFSIVNTLLAIKKQHVKPLKESFDAQRNDLEKYNHEITSGVLAQGTVYGFQANLIMLQIQIHPTDTLKIIVFKRLSLTGRPLNLVMQIEQTIQSFSSSLAKRNELIKQFQVDFKDDQTDLPLPYFGLPMRGGHVNMEYPQTVDAIAQQNDDAIYFSSLLANDLRAHGLKLAGEFESTYPKLPSPRVTEVSFKNAEKEGVMPDPKNYPDWQTAFPSREAR